MRWQASGLPVAATPGIAPKQTRAARGRPVERGPAGAGCPEPSPWPPGPVPLGLDAARPDAARPDIARVHRACDAALAAPGVDRPPRAARTPDCAAARLGRRRRTPGRPPARGRREYEQRHHGGDEGGGQQRHPRVETDGRQGKPNGSPHSVKEERDDKLRQRELGTAAAARLLPETADDRPSLPAGEAGQQVDRDPPRETFGNALKPGHVVRSRHEVATANADHGSDHSRRSIHTRTPKKHTGSPRRRISSTEYNATVCHVHGKSRSCPLRVASPSRLPCVDDPRANRRGPAGRAAAGRAGHVRPA